MSLLHRRPSRIIPQKSSAFDRRRTFSAGTSFSGFLSGFLSIAHIRFRDLPRGEGREGKGSCNSWSSDGDFCGEARKPTRRVPSRLSQNQSSLFFLLFIADIKGLRRECKKTPMSFVLLRFGDTDTVRWIFDWQSKSHLSFVACA